MKTVETFTAQIAVGFRNTDTDDEPTVEMARRICQDYCDEVGLCVTITETEFIYTGGNERGCLIGLINYPRFPSDEETILRHALALAKKLMDEYKQKKVSVITPNATYMLEQGID